MEKLREILNTLDQFKFNCDDPRDYRSFERVRDRILKCNIELILDREQEIRYWPPGVDREQDNTYRILSPGITRSDT